MQIHCLRQLGSAKPKGPATVERCPPSQQLNSLSIVRFSVPSAEVADLMEVFLVGIWWESGIEASNQSFTQQNSSICRISSSFLTPKRGKYLLPPSMFHHTPSGQGVSEVCKRPAARSCWQLACRTHWPANSVALLPITRRGITPVSDRQEKPAR